MTLYRQLAIGILLLLTLAFSGTVFINVQNLRDTLAAQLDAHARDTANSLALTLSAQSGLPDPATIESMTGAVFDRGTFRSITVAAIDGQVLLEKTRPAEYGDVPAWFTGTVTLPAPSADALVTAGWKQVATVTVTGDTSAAYRQLWNGSIAVLRLYLVMAVVLLAAGLLAVRVLLRPLQRVVQQADAISARNYTLQQRLPRTRELRNVVDAMNRLSGRVNEIFTEQSALVESLREDVFRDPVTRLGNRRYFDRLLNALPGSGDTATHGALLLLELHDIGRINATAGFAAGDALLRRAGELVAYDASQLGNCYVARISGACFAIVAPGLPLDSAQALATTLCYELFQLRAEGLVDSNNIGHVGLVMWTEHDEPGDLLPAADMALRAAQSSGQNTWLRHNPDSANQPLILGAEQWRERLRSCMERGELALFTQPVMAAGEGDACLHQEILARIPDGEHHSIAASVFMPMAERLGLASQLDKLLVSRLREYFQADDPGSGRFAINLSSTALQDAVFLQWLYGVLAQHPVMARRVNIEFPEYAAIRDLNQTRNVVERLRVLGCECGIDRFGRGFTTFGYLRGLPVGYIKLDSSFTRSITADQDDRFFLQALLRTLHSLDIKVYAQAVETRAERELLESLNVDGLQGYLCGRPTELRTPSGTRRHHE